MEYQFSTGYHCPELRNRYLPPGCTDVVLSSNNIVSLLAPASGESNKLILYSRPGAKADFTGNTELTLVFDRTNELIPGILQFQHGVPKHHLYRR